MSSSDFMGFHKSQQLIKEIGIDPGQCISFAATTDMRFWGWGEEHLDTPWSTGVFSTVPGITELSKSRRHEVLMPKTNFY